MKAKVIDREAGTAQCMWETSHGPHRWAYTSEGGGHMICVGWTDEKGYKEWDCPGYGPHPWRERVAKPAESVEHPWTTAYNNDMITYSKADIDLTMKVFEGLKNAPQITDEQVRDTFSRHPHDGQVCRQSAEIFDRWLKERDRKKDEEIARLQDMLNVIHETLVSATTTIRRQHDKDH